MKKLIFLSLLALFGMFVVSCTGEKPNFQFNLTVTAEAQEPKTDIFVTSVSTVTNDRWVYFPPHEKTIMLGVTEQFPEINNWIDEFIKKNLVAKLPDKTLYKINVVGWVKESNTGIMIFIDKNFTNDGVKCGLDNCRKLIE